VTLGFVFQEVSWTSYQCCTERERQERHFPKILGSRASRERLLYIYIYITFIFNKNMQKDKLVAKCMKTCIFVLVDEYYIIMKFEMPSIVY
jgi:hypothetical protein